MNTLISTCGHRQLAVGAPHSIARDKCERLCDACRKLIHCDTHAAFDDDCHWCGVRKEAILRMTDAERRLYLGVE